MSRVNVAFWALWWATVLLAVPAQAQTGPAHRFAEAQSLVKKGDKAAARDLFLVLANEDPSHAVAAPALFNAAFLSDELKEQELALRLYGRVIARYPKAAEAEQAVVGSATIQERLGRFVAAAQSYLLLARRYPKSRHARAAMASAAILTRATGRPGDAAALLQGYARKYRAAADAARLALMAGEWLEEAGQADAARLQYARTAKRYRRDGAIVVPALIHLARLRPKSRAKRLQAAVRADPGKRWAAEAAYLLAEDQRRAFEKTAGLPPGAPPKRLAKALKARVEQLRKADKAFSVVLEYRRQPRFAVCAMVGVGRLYDRFAKDILDYPPPKGLSDDEVDLYRTQLEDQATRIQEKAIATWSATLKKAWALGLLEPCLLPALEGLDRLAPGKKVLRAPAADRLSPRLAGEPWPLKPVGAKLRLARRVEADPKDAGAQLTIARHRLADGEHTGASEALRRALAADHTLGEAHLLLGLLHHAYRDARTARAHLETAQKDSRLSHENRQAIAARLRVLAKWPKRP